ETTRPAGKPVVEPNRHIENADNTATPVPIAVVGMACRFAGNVTSPSELWKLCADGHDGWSPIPKERFDVKTLYHTDSVKPGRNHAVGGYFMSEDVSSFDAAFFNFSADVANAMDPQIRLLLEIVYEATEDAGIPLETLAGTNTSVFSGCYGKDYHDLQSRDPEAMPASFLTGNGTAMISNRISHFYDLQGASMSIDTGCSSGLACLHQGCQTIRTGESNVSIVGASSTILNPDLFVAMSTLGMVGANGRCYAWDARAEGYGRGEGVAALVLKGLDAALQDGDHVHAVIKATGLNQDGKTQSITSPSVDAQVKLINGCYRYAGLDPADTGYVEAHMTGTQVGDLAEAKALAQTFGAASQMAASNSDPVLVGSVKTNIGHTEPVSGLAAIIKTALAMKNRQVPANLNYETSNPKIKLEDWNLRVPTNLMAWPINKPLRASINNFGYGGANAHVILEAAPPGCASANGTGQNMQYKKRDEEVSRVFIVSARDTNTTQTMAKNLAAHIRDCINRGDELSPGDLAYTLAERRSRLGCISLVKSRTLVQLAGQLESPLLKFSQTSNKKPRLGFVFNGQGAQWHAMGRELLDTYPIFGSAAREADSVLRSYGADWSLQEELLRDAQSTRVSEISISQPITVALQLCLVKLLQSWNIHPSAVVSHSSGEIAAAFTVGALSFSEALGIAYYRGELSRKYKKLLTKEGGMLAAGISASEAQRYITNTSAGGQVVVACVNSPKSVTLSGDIDDLNEVAMKLELDGVFSRKLKVPMAYHSHHMLPMSEEYVEMLRQILPANRSWMDGIQFASPVTGTIVDSPGFLTPEHWARNLTSPVLFSDAFKAINESVDMVLEIGPHSTLSGPIRQILKGKTIPYVSCLKRTVDAVETMQDVACDLLHTGYPVLVGAVNAAGSPQHQKFVPGLPLYPWNHTSSYWVESRVNRDIRQKRFPPHELLGLPISGASPQAAEWRNFLRLSDVPWLVDHQVDSQVVLPGAAYISMAVEAARLIITEDSAKTPHGYGLRYIDFLSALTVPESSVIEIRLRLKEIDSAGWYDFEVCSIGQSDDVWVENCRGQISVLEDLGGQTNCLLGPDSFFDNGEKGRDVDISRLLARTSNMGINYGPAFRNLIAGRTAANRSITDLRIADVASDSHSYLVHPTTLDCIIQSTYISLPDSSDQGSMVLPRSIQSVFISSQILGKTGDKLQVLSELQKVQKKGFTSEVGVGHAGVENASVTHLRIEKLFCQAVPRGVESVDGDKEPEISQCKSLWELDVLHNVPKAIKDSMRINLTDDEVAFEKQMLRASYYYICDALSQIEKESQENWEWHHKIMFRWMVTVVELGKKGAFGVGSTKWSRASRGMKQVVFDELARGDASCQLTARVGAKLTDILRGRITPLELMMEGDLLNRYYMDLPKLKSRSYKHVARMVELFAVKHPGAQVLEIGGGTGGATQVILEGFGARTSGAGTLLGHYTFTDVSSGFFEAARQKFAAWDGLIDFQKLDIETNPIEQSDVFTSGKFDLIVASMVLHATKSLDRTMRNVRKLLKPGGKLLLVETTQDKLDMQLIFGTLPGWWLSEEPTRTMSPNVDRETWNEVLRRTGFTGVDFEIGDCEQRQFQCSSVILSTATRTPTLPPTVTVVYTVPVPEAWNRQLVDRSLEKSGTAINYKIWDDVQPENKVYIFTGDMTAPFLDNIDKTSYEKLQQLIARSRGILWLSSGGSVDEQAPLYAQTYGLLRTLRQEDTTKPLIHLDFEQTNGGPWTGDKIDHIIHVLTHAMAEDHVNSDWEYAIKDSMLHVPRFFPGNLKVPEPILEQQPFYQRGQTLVWEPSDKIFIKNGQVKSNIPSDMLEIEVKAFDVDLRTVPNDGEEIAAYHLGGVVTRVGADAEASGFHVGDRVGGLTKGRFTNIAQTHMTSVVKVPGMSFVEAASIPVAYAAAYHALIIVAKLRQGESVLVHPGMSDVGQAAIVIAQNIGADVFATFDKETERSILKDKYHVVSHRIFSTQDVSNTISFNTQSKRNGMNVILTSPASRSNNSLGNFLTRFGRFIQTGGIGAKQGRRPLSQEILESSATYANVDIMELAEYDGRAFQEAIVAGVEIWNKMGRGMSTSLPFVQYPVSQLDEAVRQQGQKGNTAKVLVVIQQEDVVNVTSSLKPLSFDAKDATYLIVGGLGGIGRAIASWMMDNGARNLLIVSRNAEKHPDAAILLRRAKNESRNLQIHNCDVSSEESLVALLEDVGDSLPPIRGVVDAAMVLEDSVFESMTFDQWKRAVLPKVAGTTNLDRHLSPNLSFFVLLSSLTGVAGHVSQANYSAGNTFQDAFARHRAAKGQFTISIDLSAVSGVGYIAAADNDAAKARIDALGSTSIPIESVLTLLDKALSRGEVTPGEAQVVVGLQPWRELADDSIVRRDKRFGTLRSSGQQRNMSALGAGNLETEILSPTAMLVQALGNATKGEDGLANGEVARAIAARLATIFNINDETIDLNQALAIHGVDSLVAVELRNWLAATSRAKLSIFEILHASSLHEIASLTLARAELS
ncbi:uncharacterized protein TRUGW13939_09508, partial [Talaromyces rugulosus]